MRSGRTGYDYPALFFAFRLAQSSFCHPCLLWRASKRTYPKLVGCRPLPAEMLGNRKSSDFCATLATLTEQISSSNFAMPQTSSTGCPPWLRIWLTRKLIYSLHPVHQALWLFVLRPRQSQSFFSTLLIRSRRDSLTVLHGQEATLPVSPVSSRSWRGNGWSCSRKRFRSFREERFCGIRRIQGRRGNGKRSKAGRKIQGC